MSSVAGQLAGFLSDCPASALRWLQLPRLGSFSAGTVFTAHQVTGHKMLPSFAKFSCKHLDCNDRDGEDGDDGVGMLMIMVINVDYLSQRVCIQADLHYSQLLAGFKLTRLQIMAALFEIHMWCDRLSPGSRGVLVPQGLSMTTGQH